MLDERSVICKLTIAALLLCGIGATSIAASNLISTDDDNARNLLNNAGNGFILAGLFTSCLGCCPDKTIIPLIKNCSGFFKGICNSKNDDDIERQEERALINS